MAVAKRPKQKPSRSDNRQVKSKTKQKPAKSKDTLDEDERKRLKKEKKRRKKEEKEQRSLVVQKIGKQGEKKLRLTKKRLKELEEMTGEFKVDLPDIFSMIDDQDAKAEDIQKAFLRAAFATVVSLIPVMEEQAHKKRNESGAYALNALLSQGREIAADLRALQSSEEIAARISALVIDPSYMSIVATIVQTLSNLRDEMEKFVQPGKEMQMRQIFQIHAVNIGQFLDVSRSNVKARIEEMIE